MQPSRGCIVKMRHARAYSAEGGTGTDARPSASRTAGRSSAPPGRGQAAKAVFRRSRMARIRRMRGAPQAGRAARRQARTPPERPNAPAPTARDSAPASRRTEAERAGARSGRTRSQSNDWREVRYASETALSARSERLGRNHAHVWEGAQETPCRISTSDCAEIAVPPLAYKGFAIFMSEKMRNLQWRNFSPFFIKCFFIFQTSRGAG